MAVFGRICELPLKDLEPLKQEMKCGVCKMVFEDPVLITCGHVFCRECALQNLSHAARCPLCRAEYNHRSLYPLPLLKNMIDKLGEIGTNLGVADITATQYTQPFVFKPFVPPVRANAALSQYLRDAKSQIPDFSGSDEEDDTSSSSSEEQASGPLCPAGHPLVRETSKNWVCSTHPEVGQCASKMVKTTKTNRACLCCEQCSYRLCLTCGIKYKKNAEGKAEPAETENKLEKVCAFCNLHPGSEEDCTALIAKIEAEDDEGDSCEDGVLGSCTPASMAKELGPLKGPFPITWSVGSKRDEERVSQTLRVDAQAHDLCLLWTPGTKVNKKGDIVPRSVPPTLRAARRKRCHSCQGYGASLVCDHKNCKKTFHIPCGLFTSAIGTIDEEEFKVFCQEHSAKKRRLC